MVFECESILTSKVVPLDTTSYVFQEILYNFLDFQKITVGSLQMNALYMLGDTTKKRSGTVITIMYVYHHFITITYNTGCIVFLLSHFTARYCSSYTYTESSMISTYGTNPFKSYHCFSFPRYFKKILFIIPKYFKSYSHSYTYGNEMLNLTCLCFVVSWISVTTA